MKNEVLTLIENHPRQLLSLDLTNKGKCLSLDLTNKEIEDDDIELVIKAIIQHRPSLQELHLDSNKLTDHGAMKLAEHLPKLSQLTLLSIQFNQIDQRGAEHVFAVRNDLADLEILFHGNKIKDAGFMHKLELTTSRSRF